ncbi:hypothetical protein [Pseudomonas putida]|uniref:Phage ABA sandwich domain-containing protein n=1 Tax=Pseudomonas putida TaxID=303 RepID=A0A6S5U393_PSEPU|nr:hypothetical protein [Pseudomonas putida]BBT41029.1 hypothetical protein WP8W18C01_33700 [Pseudomonas putida]
MTDQQLLELAAKAAGIEGGWGPVFNIGNDEVDVSDIWFLDSPETGSIWDPLTDDGDALRLLCKLQLSLNSNSATVGVGGYTPGWDHVFAQEQIVDGDAQSAHRRAIVRAAAEIGNSMQGKH